MSSTDENNLYGVYASFNIGEVEKEYVKQLLWGANGLKELLSEIKWFDYGRDIEIILFEFHVNPIPYELNNIKEIGNYRQKEKSIGIPIILDQDGFFKLNSKGKEIYLRTTILDKLKLLRNKIKRNKLDLDIEKLILVTQLKTSRICL